VKDRRSVNGEDVLSPGEVELKELPQPKLDTPGNERLLAPRSVRSLGYPIALQNSTMICFSAGKQCKKCRKTQTQEREIESTL
jgi:hypothetical protein